jgi:hypothetical protein
MIHIVSHPADKERTVAAKESFFEDKGWKVTAITFMLSTVLQMGGWVYWFGGWKGEVGLRITALENVVKDLPEAVKRIDITQQVMNSKLTDLLNRDRADRYVQPRSEAHGRPSSLPLGREM